MTKTFKDILLEAPSPEMFISGLNSLNQDVRVMKNSVIAMSTRILKASKLAKKVGFSDQAGDMIKLDKIMLKVRSGLIDAEKLIVKSTGRRKVR